MYPTRSAPTPPRADRGDRREALPADHPFTDPFPYHTPYQHNCSTSSLSSSAYTPSASTPVSSRSPSRRAPQSPTARLAQPLSPARSASPPSISTTNPVPPPAPVYTTLPTELSLFDARPRQTLLQDVEYILGKKMHFPFLARYSSSSSSSSSVAKKEKKAAKKEKKAAKKEKGAEKEKKSRRLLTKERAYDDDWAIWAGVDEFMDSQAVVVEEKKSRRGVREGNWI
ncbi:hypothetical protein L202_04488 [Cryptococcus amylolentus CBS 6039]|uniref:Uncharacterized protein n=1 Tax=Cryptococcus amylolentus CBS 6039 TaxID=1295533 RepID=A0A1E3HS54_9TREE|nr:hypothetical protein L202_04488 [Cryptococcus amylolentus CBS 6039]ODN78975.1 hypothetical protein L202_04488 [Cryptococcus amylolentus CBS 6039]